MTFETSPTGYWLGRCKHYHDRGLAAGIARLVAGGSILDLGAGDGSYVAYWRSLGLDARGVDGNPTTWGEALTVADLAEPLWLPVADWVVCLEVLEHIPTDFEATAIDNCDAHNVVGLVVSWARPGQGGRGHYNEREPAYVRSLFAERGYLVDDPASITLRQRAKLRWFKANTLVLRRRGRRAA